MWNPILAWKRPARLWRELCFVTLGSITGTISFTVAISLLSTSLALLITFPLALPVIWLLFTGSRLMAGAERSRLASMLDVELRDPVPALQRRGWFRRLRERAGSVPRWKEIAYLHLAFPTGIAGFMVVMAAWCGSVALLALPLYVEDLPGRSAKFGLFEVGPGGGAVVAALVGAAVLFVAPTVTGIVTWAQVGLARVLLGPGRDEELTEEVSRLEHSRSAAVDSAEAERRRIERDLHDGAQQRLVALAAELGAAREKLEADDVEGGRVLVADAHEEAKAALKEIRDLVRGIHPVILEDRGLDAALSAVVARAPIPVALRVDATPRPSAPAESTAYFVVNEALTNIARHAQATRAEVSIARAGDRLVIEVRDDGVGGADASRGTGLQGLRDRIAALGGTMHVISPDGGPTTISVEVPCGS